jgi:hypothetical protein
MTVTFSPVAVLRIAKHAETGQGTVSGCLVGLDSESGSLEVTNVFLHPAKGAADFQPQQSEEAGQTTGAEAVATGAAAVFQADAVRLLKSANLDGNIVGWFQSSTLSSFVNEATVEIQFDYQTQNKNSVLVVGDVSFGTDSPIKAFRLTEEYMAFHKAMRERQNQGPATLITGGPVTFNTGSMRVFEEVEIKIQLSVLDEAFLFENRQRLVDSVGVKPSSDSSAGQAMQLLMECVEDLAIEKVRFAQVSAGKTATGATRLRGEGEVKRLQSANAIVLLTENVRRLSETVGAAAKEQEINATVFGTIRA